MFVASLSVPFLLSEGICMGEDNIGKAELVGTLFFVCGIVTLLQGFFGVRQVSTRHYDVDFRFYE